MIIGIDIRVLSSNKRSGVEEYTEQLLAHMLPLDPDIQFNLFYSSFSRPLEYYPWLELPNVQLMHMRVPSKILSFTSRTFSQPQFDRLLGGVDTFFSPHFLLAPLSPSCRRVTTFHDLSYERFPEFLSYHKQLWHRYQIQPKWQAKFSNSVIAVSESTKRDLVELYDIDPAKIHAIHSGVSASFRPTSLDEQKRVREKYNLPKKFVLFLGMLEPRKNITGLVEAFELVKEKMNDANLALVVAGHHGWLYGDILKRVQDSPYRGQINFLPSVADADRTALYGAAEVFVYPSFFEGFGFPVLEAMACGVPVVASNTSSLPEVVGSAGLLVDPYNTSEIAQAIESVLTDDQLRQLLVHRGIDRVRRFSWKTTAEKTLEVLARK